MGHAPPREEETLPTIAATCGRPKFYKSAGKPNLVGHHEVSEYKFVNVIGLEFLIQDGTEVIVDLVVNSGVKQGHSDVEH